MIPAISIIHNVTVFSEMLFCFVKCQCFATCCVFSVAPFVRLRNAAEFCGVSCFVKCRVLWHVAVFCESLQCSVKYSCVFFNHVVVFLTFRVTVPFFYENKSNNNKINFWHWQYKWKRVWLGAPANAHISPSSSVPFQGNCNKCFMNVNALYREIWHIFLGPHPLLSFAFHPKSTQSLQMGYH